MPARAQGKGTKATYGVLRALDPIDYTNVSVLDISGAALDADKARLGRRAPFVNWIEADILDTVLPRHAYDLWHDRAAFHFLTAANDRLTYVKALIRAVKPGRLVIMATFADDGPARCSGLPVVRYNEHTLSAELGDGFMLLRD